MYMADPSPDYRPIDMQHILKKSHGSNDTLHAASMYHPLADYSQENQV